MSKRPCSCWGNRISALSAPCFTKFGDRFSVVRQVKNLPGIQNVSVNERPDA